MLTVLAYFFGITSIEQLSNTLKRDRENCTVFVSDLPSTAGEEAIRTLFKDVSKKQLAYVMKLDSSLVW